MGDIDVMEITVKTIPHDAQRYKTVGDYWVFPGVINVRVSDTGRNDYSFLIAIHEIIEAYLTYKRGIEETKIMAFDIAHSLSEEPGAEPDSPYYQEHLFATAIEMLVAEQLKINWEEYSKAVNKL